MKRVEAKGRPCPLPLVMTRKALETLGEGEQLEIILDSRNAKHNVTQFLKDNGMAVTTFEEEGQFRLLVEKPGTIAEDSRPEDYCTP
ncbi:MAG: sulfurtransferase TusA family protein [Bacteroidales bacterium]